ncbi:ankyrin repeat domain-containing protein, partial [Geitlerinema sp. CS-897]|nr:ankyrin repeat domain-containing protein [Geitlerinema sp. CS-897]
ETLISYGVNVNVKDDNHMTPLHQACTRGNLDIVKLLISSGAEINAKAKDGTTPINMASHSKQLKVAQFLKETGADIDVFDAIAVGDIDLLIELSKTAGFDFNQVNTKHTMKGCPLLNFACRYEHIDIINYLLINNANVNSAGKPPYEYPLHEAAFANNEKALKILLDFGANINIENLHGWTSLHIAASFEYIDMVQAIINLGGDINYLDREGCSSLFYASQNYGDEIVKILIENSAKVNIKDAHGCSPLHYAMRKKGRIKIIKLLVENGVDFHSQGEGRSAMNPLIVAIAQKDEEVVNLLLEHGAGQEFGFG